ncbi:MAG: hypothetical protein RL077_6276 [Verrucomicrobiota bacterium]
MNLLAKILDYSLWPALMLIAGTGLGVGLSLQHGPLAFNLTYLVLAGVLYLLEKARPHEPTWLETDGQEIPDVAHTLVTKVAVQVAVVALANSGITWQWGARSGGPIWPTHWPLPLQVSIALISAEFGLYWAHRIAHEWPALWRFHAVHHSSERLWFLNTGRFHFVDTLKSLILSIPILLGAGAPGDVIVWVSGLTAFIGILTHCNVRMRFGWLNFIFNTPGLHRWHHSKDLREGNKNYGENLVIWDLIFRTYYDDARRRPPAEIGIRAAMPRTFYQQVVVPFIWNKYQRKEALKKRVVEAPLKVLPGPCPRPPED